MKMWRLSSHGWIKLDKQVLLKDTLDMKVDMEMV